MRTKLVYLLIIWVTLLSSAQAEVVVLHSGQQIKGEILLNNDEVIIVRKKDGLRYQIPKAEVQSIYNETIRKSTADTTNVATKKVAIRLTATGGLAYIPHQGWGGMTEENLMIGTYNLLDKQIFLGGSVGFRGVFRGINQYTWIPLQIITYLPISTIPTTKHRPLIGASFGYAFSTNKQADGGLCAGIECGYWCRINNRSSLSIALTTQWQQTRIDVIETIQQVEYTNRIGCNLIGIGLKANIQF